MGYVENYQLSWSIHMKKLGKKTLISRRKSRMDRDECEKSMWQIKVDNVETIRSLLERIYKKLINQLINHI